MKAFLLISLREGFGVNDAFGNSNHGMEVGFTRCDCNGRRASCDRP